MKHTLKNQTRPTRMMLAGAVAFAVFWTGTALADATFKSADISIEPRGEEAGGLTCSWRETGLESSQVVYYKCGAAAVGVLEACTYKNRVIYNSPTEQDSFKDVTGEHGSVPFLAQKNGQINGSTTTPIPEREVPEGQELCTAPSEATVVAVRWCNASLSDATNNVTGAEVGELFQEFIPGVGSVPSCPELLASP